ncbi:hypothetical protein B0H14DRAFT_2202283, partial [Mycena olivaceomarginata]
PVAKSPAAKEWVKKAETNLEKDAFGPRWAELVSQWYLREQQTGFMCPTKGHPAKLRPKEIGVWVQRARTGSPDIKDVARFADEWRKWWQDINPAWRKVTLPMQKKDSGPWTLLDVPGQNGFLNVLIGLKWWREKLEVESEEWREAADDVCWVLKQ